MSEKGRITDCISIKNAHIMFRNFSGRPGQYNRDGKRAFSVIIEDPDMAKKLLSDGWNVHERQAKEEGDPPVYTIQVEASFDNIPPRIMRITAHNKMILDAEDVGMLDTDEIKTIDLIIRPYNWEVNGKKGVKAYLKSMYVTIDEDEFAEKYAE